MNTAVMTRPVETAALIGLRAARRVRRSRSAKALLSLMALYEQGEGIGEPEESETELMVLLSGMVGVDTSLLPGE